MVTPSHSTRGHADLSLRARCARRSTWLAMLLALGACSDDDNDDDTDSGVGAVATVAWQACAADATLDCAVYDAPLIHDGNDSRTIAIDLVRLPATGPNPELLMLNPGGPGGAGTVLIREFQENGGFPVALRERFDIVGFDPRGIGESQHIGCDEFLTDEIEIGYLADASLAEGFAMAQAAFNEACVEKHGDVLDHLGSRAVVRDMDLLREAMGHDRLNFIGYSYGTRLASLYLERFPDRSGRVVLDGPLPPDASFDFLLDGTAVAQQRNLDALLDACGTSVPDCDRTTIEARMEATIETLLATDADALDLFGELLIESVENPEFGALAMEPLLTFALTGDTGPVEELLELLGALDDADDGGGDDAADDDSDTVGRAVLCADDPARPDAASLVRTLQRLDALSNLFAEVLVGDLAGLCVGWPAAVDPVAPVSAVAAPPSLVIGGTSDAQTPIEWAPLMAEAIGGTLLISDHPGHTVALTGTSACVDEATIAFLLDGTLPTESRCEIGSNDAEAIR